MTPLDGSDDLDRELRRLIDEERLRDLLAESVRPMDRLPAPEPPPELSRRERWVDRAFLAVVWLPVVLLFVLAFVR